MTLQVSTERVSWWPCKVKRPRDDGSGRFQTQTFRVKFRLADRSLFVGKTNEQLESDLQDSLYESILDWEVEIDGERADAIAENFDAVFQDVAVFKSVIDGWIEASLGGAERKN